MDLPMGKPIKVRYTNWKNQTADRHIVPIEIFFGSNEYHPEPQELLRCFDIDKDAERTYATKDIHSWAEDA